jgi:hypothetical protein
MTKTAQDLQLDRFKNLVRQIKVDEDEAHWEGRVKTIARQKPNDVPERFE